MISSAYELMATQYFSGFRFPLLTFSIAIVITWLLTPYVRNLALKKKIIDDPNRDDRRVHESPVPKWGGIAICGGILFALLAILPFANPGDAFPRYVIAIFVCALLIMIMGLYDDKHHFKARYQFLFLIAIGFVVQLFSGDGFPVQIKGFAYPFLSDPSSPSHWYSFGWLAWPFTTIYIFIVTKTMDTIDGIDGLTAGIAAIAGMTLSIVGTYGGQPRVALMAAAIAGASIGFLKYNYHPAKIFMGTGGAQPLGFMLACLSIVGAFKTAATISFIIPLLVFGIPIIDAAFVTIRRLYHRQPITQADTRHIHHTLLRQGLNQRQAVWILYILTMILCAILLTLIVLMKK